jgi:CRISPR-associated protein Cas4
MLIPVTYLSSYLYCPRKLYIERVLKVFEPPKESLVLGKIAHEARDAVNKSEREIVSSISMMLPSVRVLQRFKKRHAQILRDTIIRNKQALRSFDLQPGAVFKDFWPAVLEETLLRAHNVHEFMAKTKLVGARLWEKLYPKYHSEYPVQSERLKLKGVVDKLAIYPAHYIPIEMKTGRPPVNGLWPGHRLQLASYMMLLAEKLGQPVPKGIAQYGSTERELHLNPFMVEEVTNTTEKVIALLKDSNPPPFCQNRRKCDACGLKNVCESPESPKAKSLNSTALTE